MLRLHQLKDTDGSGNEDRSVVGNFSVEEVIYKGVPPLVTFSFSSTLQIVISSIVYFLVYSGCSGERRLFWPF